MRPQSIESNRTAWLQHPRCTSREVRQSTGEQVLTGGQVLQHVHVDAAKRFEYCHVVCSRVVDKWRLSEADHTQVHRSEQ